MKALKSEFNRWFRNTSIPEHVILAKIITLSKTDSPYPPIGKIRTISIHNSVYKIYARVILNRLHENIQ